MIEDRKLVRIYTKPNGELSKQYADVQIRWQGEEPKLQEGETSFSGWMVVEKKEEVIR